MPENLRTMGNPIGKAKDVKSTKQLAVDAHECADFASTNSLSEYVSNPPPHGPLGGKGTN